MTLTSNSGAAAVLRKLTMRDIKYHWLAKSMEPGTCLTSNNILRDVGILADGTLHNPNGYPEDVVRSTVLEAIERGKKRRSDAAKKAAVTRAIRTERRVYEVVRKLGLGHKYGPRVSCYICGKGLDDQQSIERGIGSDCWQRVMNAMSQRGGDPIEHSSPQRFCGTNNTMKQQTYSALLVDPHTKLVEAISVAGYDGIKRVFEQAGVLRGRMHDHIEGNTLYKIDGTIYLQSWVNCGDYEEAPAWHCKPVPGMRHYGLTVVDAYDMATGEPAPVPLTPEEFARTIEWEDSNVSSKIRFNFQ